MKANEAPEKIYVHVRANKGLGTTWHSTWIGVHDIEYTRTDDFIKKACSWLSNVSIEDMTYKYGDFNTSEGWDKFIEDFRKYISL